MLGYKDFSERFPDENRTGPILYSLFPHNHTVESQEPAAAE